VVQVEGAVQQGKRGETERRTMRCAGGYFFLGRKF